MTSLYKLQARLQLIPDWVEDCQRIEARQTAIIEQLINCLDEGFTLYPTPYPTAPTFEEWLRKRKTHRLAATVQEAVNDRMREIDSHKFNL